MTVKKSILLINTGDTERSVRKNLEQNRSQRNCGLLECKFDEACKSEALIYAKRLVKQITGDLRLHPP